MAALRDLSGQQFGKWTVLRWAETISFSRQRWLCRCSCGTERTVIGNTLINGTSKSCGCAGRERSRRHGLSESLTYTIWASMKQRCNNPKHKQYPHYGGRGITVCDRWMEFENFFADMGEKPDGLTLDRVDNDGNYHPDNCRWATPREQMRNRRNTCMVEFEGKSISVATLAERTGVPNRRLRERLRRGMAVEAAIEPRRFTRWSAINA
jgi:hypothetical protein